RELIADQYAQLEQAGHSADEKIPLSQVFIDLPTTTRRPTSSDSTRSSMHDDTPRFVAHIIQEAGQNLRILESEPAKETQRRVDPLNINKNVRLGRYVLIGGPGQGKTTVAQYICQMFRCALLADVPSSRLETNVLSAITDLTAHWRMQGLDRPA